MIKINEELVKKLMAIADTDNPILKIETLEGLMIAAKGDYIIKEVQGEFYPCKPDIFAETYEVRRGRILVKGE